ncbi:MAG TPA: hypothetical protein VF021_12025, partial [Longimicrobiales bacterium]
TTVWASGTGGTVLRSIDSGAHFTVMKLPNADSLDFRDIAAFDADHAYVLGAGEDGRIYHTTDGGQHWQLQFRNEAKGAFFDCFDFWDRRHGVAMSDPVNGRFLLVRTDDGTDWQPIAADRLPAAAAGEAAFAASGTCLVAVGARRLYLATGGGAQARVFVSEDRAQSWRVQATPVPAGSASAGIFSLAFRDPKTGIALGGDYQKPAEESALAATVDAGRNWALGGRTAYVSGAAFVPNSNIVVAVGTTGTRISDNRGVTWSTIDTLEYNAVQMASDGTGLAVGPRGRIARLVR